MSKINQPPRPAAPIAQTTPVAQEAVATEEVLAEAPIEAAPATLPGTLDQFSVGSQSAPLARNRPMIVPKGPGMTAAQLSPMVGQDPRMLSANILGLVDAPAVKMPSPMATQPGASLMEQRLQSSTGRLGGTGGLGLADPNVAPARRHATAVGSQPVDWDNPARAIDNMSQIDSDSIALNQRGGDDAVRCGAASLIAGAVLRGKEGFQDGMWNIGERADALIDRYRNLATVQMPDGRMVSTSTPEGSRIRDGLVGQISGARGAIMDYADNPDNMTYGGAQGLQQAVYEVALLDQRLSRDHSTYVGTEEGRDRGTLRTGAVQTYRDLAWVGQNPQMNGQDLEMFWVSNEASGGHYVLANNQADGAERAVAFNPWPEADGSAYSRAADGQGVSVVPMGQENHGQDIRGFDVDTEGRALPTR